MARDALLSCHSECLRACSSSVAAAWHGGLDLCYAADLVELK